ncbi:substrate-binding periplasmic protein [Undibacterium sp. SXout7W]|uniref:substrate-binding periplasmic protein n=1 Tax=Undibacterium sp. SXout7W TaxID=3413049 RepID=UPI003BF1268E
MVFLWRFMWLPGMLAALLASQAHAIELRIHVSPLPPYVMNNPQQGIVSELIQKALATQGIKTVFILSNNKRMESEVAAGTTDAGFAGIPVDHPGIYFSDPLIEYENIVVSLSSSRLKINQIADLSHKKIITFRNAKKILGKEFASITENNPGYFEVGEQRSQLPMLDAGRGDVILLDKRAFLYFARSLHGSNDIRQRYTQHALFKPISHALGFYRQQNRDIFNLGLKVIRQNGEYAEVLRRYIGE